MSKVQGARSPKKRSLLSVNEHFEDKQQRRNLPLKYFLLVVHIFKIKIQNLRHLFVRLFCWTFRIELQRF